MFPKKITIFLYEICEWKLNEQMVNYLFIWLPNTNPFEAWERIEKVKNFEAILLIIII